MISIYYLTMYFISLYIYILSLIVKPINFLTQNKLSEL